jgi:hypothetical protein
VNNTENHDYIKQASKQVCGGTYAKMENPGAGSSNSAVASSSYGSGLNLFNMSAPVRRAPAGRTVGVVR